VPWYFTIRTARILVLARQANDAPPAGLHPGGFHFKLVRMKKKVVSVDPEVMGGTPCFTGTRVPIQTFLDYVEGGDSIDEFLANFPTVRRNQVIAFLQNATEYFVAIVTNGDDADLELSRVELARLNSWADEEHTAGRTRVFESPSAYVAHVRAKRTAKGKSR
jgi:uncharacterized protein (DUF433 family)